MKPRTSTPDTRQPELFALAEVQFVPTGDGAYRTVLKKPVLWASVKEAARITGERPKVIYNLYHAELIKGRKPTPKKIEIDMDSLRAHLKAGEDSEHWTAERRAAYRRTRKS